MNTSKTRVRRNFTHARELMRQAEQMMVRTPNPEDMEAVANELIACVATFSEWIEEQGEQA